jgi:hypothetical protein
MSPSSKNSYYLSFLEDIDQTAGNQLEQMLANITPESTFYYTWTGSKLQVVKRNIQSSRILDEREVLHSIHGLDYLSKSLKGFAKRLQQACEAKPKEKYVYID